MNIRELNERRANSRLLMEALSMMNVPSDPEERLRADARYRLACDAYERTEREFQQAINALSTDDLVRLSGGEPVESGPTSDPNKEIVQ